jgi:hypothetical protein
MHRDAALVPAVAAGNCARSVRKRVNLVDSRAGVLLRFKHPSNSGREK